MPYIKQVERNRFENTLNDIMHNLPANAGELNYMLSRICDIYIQVKGKNYQNLNEVIGVLECVKQEYYRRIVVPYEDKKIEDNTDVYGILPQKK